MKKIYIAWLLVIMGNIAHAQLYNGGLITNDGGLVSDWENQWFNTSTGVFDGYANGVFEHHGPSSQTMVNDGVFNAYDGHIDKFMGPLGSTGTQEIGGAVRPYFYNLELINGSGQLINVTNTDGANVRNLTTFSNGITTTIRSIHQKGALRFEDNATYTGGNSDAQHVNGYVSKIGNDAFTFPVGSGTDIRTLTINAPATGTDQYGVAWIVGDPTSTTDPSGSPALHPVATFDVATLTAVSPVGQWDWISGIDIAAVTSPTPANSPAGTGTGAGLNISVSIPDMTSFASADKLRLVGWNGTQWVNLSTGSKPYAGGTSYANGVAENSILEGTMIAGITAIGIGTFAPAPVTLAGSVYNDVNGLQGSPLNTIDGPKIPFATLPLHANLFTESGVFVATVPLDASGNYLFTNVTPSANYQVTISETAAAAGSTPATSVGLPSGWFNTGETANGAGTGSDGSPNGIAALIAVGSSDVSNINFGIEQAPETAVNSQPSQLNPGGTTNITIPGSAFSISNVGANPNTSDPAPGAVTGIKITSFPATVTSITIAGTPYTSVAAINSIYPDGIPTDANGVPTVTVEIDPVDGITSVILPIAAVDAAGIQDQTPGSITLPFQTPFAIAGNVWNDGNGDAVINGTENNTITDDASETLTVYITDNTGKIVAKADVLANGTYSTTVPAGTYTVTLSNDNTLTVGSTVAIPTTLPNSNWANTGTNFPAAGANPNDAASGSITVGASDVTNVNFGIEKKPLVTDETANSTTNPGGAAISQVTFPTGQGYSGTDLEDGAYAANLAGETVTLYPPSSGGNLYYDTNGIGIADPGEQITAATPIASFDPTKVYVDPTLDGATSVQFDYAVTDAAGVISDPQTILVPFAAPIVLSGNVWNDGDGDAVVDGTEGNTVTDAPTETLTVYITDNTGKIIAKADVLADGTYSTTVPAGTYTVTLSNDNTLTVGSTVAIPTTLPNSNWTNTGTNFPGTGPNPNGGASGSVTISTSDVTNVNFGLDKRPVVTDETAITRINPGGTTLSQITFPTAQGYSATDLEDGAFPGNLAGETVTLAPGTGGLLYYDANGNGAADPGEQITVATPISNFDPAKVYVDPAGTSYNDTPTVTFTYSVADNAGVASTPMTVTAAFIANPLPVTLASFTVKKGEGNTARLDWTTTSEANSEKFEVQHSVDGSKWNVITAVAAKGESKELVAYNYTDTAPVNGENLYRLKMIDFDGTFAYSKINSLNFEKGVAALKLSLYPNPAVDMIRVEMEGSTGSDQIRAVKLYNMNGVAVYSSNKLVDGRIDVSRVPAGAYVMAVTHANGTIHNAKVVIVK